MKNPGITVNFSLPIPGFELLCLEFMQTDKSLILKTFAATMR